MKEFKGDKRSKGYKEWKKNHDEASKGLGDTVEKFTKATGIKKVVDTVFNKLEKSCGCDERKEKLNYLFPNYRPNCLTEDEYNYLSERVGKLNTVTAEEQKALLDIYNRVFNDRRELTGCNSCFLNGVWKKLERIFNEYK
jgi:hypothetical protein